MEARRKQELRSLIHTIPSLVKAHLVNQAFETETIIASTFQLSEPFRVLMHNIPQNYIENIASWYSKLSFKAFQGGLNNAKLKLETINMTAPAGEEREEEIKTKIPMPYTLSQHLAKTFQDNIGNLVQTVPNSSDIFVQFKKDLEKAYRDGVSEHLKMLDEEKEQEEEQREEEEKHDVVDGTEFEDDAEERDEERDEELEEFEEEDIDDEAAMEAEEDIDEEAFLKELLDEIESEPTVGRDEQIDSPVEGTIGESMNKKLASKLRRDPVLADVTPNEVLRALEEYTKIPGDAEAEMVLRYTLGLPPAGKPKAEKPKVEKVEKAPKATASMKRSIVRGGKVIGPYDTQALRQKVKAAAKTHVLDDNDLQTIVIDSIVSDIDQMGSKEAAQAIAKKLGFSEALASKEISLQDVKSRSDVLAQKLTTSLGLPGEMIFLDVDGDYLLTFAFHRSEAAKLSDEAGSTVRAAKIAKRRPLPNNPQGVLSKRDQVQISSLADLSKSRTMRDIRKASPKVAAYLNDVLKNIRIGRVGLSEGSSKLRANISDVIAEVFGMDGLGYFEYLTTRKKRA